MRLTLAPLGESDFGTPMGAIGPLKSGRVASGASPVRVYFQSSSTNPECDLINEPLSCP